MVRLLALAPLSALLMFGCGTPGAVESRLRACGLVSEGELSARLSNAFYLPDACYRDCIGAATCEELSGALCGTSITLLQRCDARCAHHCPDGSLIALELVCDGFSQCGDDSDEAACATFRCADGTSLPDRRHCDGTSNCSDGSDEVGCPGAFSCRTSWGDLITGVGVLCDGYPICADGSDEVGCAEFACTDGTRVPVRSGASPRCNGWSDCSDGSDETGCATLTPMCGAP